MVKVLLGAILDSANVGYARHFAEGVLKQMLWFAKAMGENELRKWILTEYQMTEEGVEEIMGLIGIIMEKVCYLSGHLMASKCRRKRWPRKRRQ
jgi:hypothetical protein